MSVCPFSDITTNSRYEITTASPSTGALNKTNKKVHGQMAVATRGLPGWIDR